MKISRSIIKADRIAINPKQQPSDAIRKICSAIQMAHSQFNITDVEKNKELVVMEVEEILNISWDTERKKVGSCSIIQSAAYDRMCQVKYQVKVVGEIRELVDEHHQ